MSECISVMEEALTALARGQAHQPLRTVFKPPEVKGVMAMMPAFREGQSPMFGLKAICVFPGNAAMGKDAHQGGVMLFDGSDGELLALVNASAITAIRTAAVSALATRLLRRRVGCRAVRHANFSQVGVMNSARPFAFVVKQLCQTKVENLYLARSRDHYVAGLDVAMDDSARVRRSQRVGHLDRDRQSAAQIEWPAADQLPHVFPFDKLHCNEVDSSDLVEIENGADVRMVQ